MLSKLFHCDYSLPARGGLVSANIILKALFRDLKQSYYHVKVEGCRPGGTLGIFYNAEINGEKRFIKTHLPGEMYQANLIKEIKILTVLYGDCLKIERRDVMVHTENQTFLIMDELKSLERIPTMAEIKSFIKGYSHKLDVLSNYEEGLGGMCTFSQVYDEGLKALILLAQYQLINPFIDEQCRKYMEGLKAMSVQTRGVLCHGDLSNKNIMMMGDKPIVIDWEDAFIGVDEYDFCYWLTFFDQRRYYNRDLTDEFYVQTETAIALMVLVTVLKCYLSYKNNSYKTNLVTFDQRLKEILDLRHP